MVVIVSSGISGRFIRNKKIGCVLFSYIMLMVIVIISVVELKFGCVSSSSMMMLVMMIGCSKF